MARIRTIKPEFWVSEQIIECSPIARLLFIGLWNFCDDGGVHPRSIKRLKAAIFPADDTVSTAQVEEMLAELEENELIASFDDGKKSYLFVTGWADHQRIDRPNYKYPGPLNSDNRRMIDEHSTNDRRTIDERSPPESKGREGKGEESKGVEGSGVEGNTLSPSGDVVVVGPDAPELIRQVFDHYRTHKPKSHPKPHSEMKEWAKIRARLKEGHSVETLCEAIDGCFASPWHQGENERQRAFNSLELIMRDSSKVSQFLELAETRGSPVMSERSQRNKRAADQFNARFAELFDEEEVHASE